MKPAFFKATPQFCTNKKFFNSFDINKGNLITKVKSNKNFSLPYKTVQLQFVLEQEQSMKQ